jgi:tRNA(fMet)-specific endonuclease VapC
MGARVRAGYLLDTNHLGLAVTVGTSVHVRLVSLRRRGVRIGTCIPVLCEIERGVHFVREPDVYRRNLQHLLSRIRLWPLDVLTSTVYGRVAADLQRRGRVLSQVDMMLASLAEQMNLVLVSTDLDFDALPHIPREDWTKP